MSSVENPSAFVLAVPQLVRFTLLSFHADHTPITGKHTMLEADVDEQFAVRLEEKAKHADDSQQKKYWVTVEVRIRGEWHAPDDQSPVIKLDARYQGRFEFRKEGDIEFISALLGKDTYRFSLVAQVYPLAQQHLVEQLRLMSLNVRRSPGLDPMTMMEEVQVTKPAGVVAPKKSGAAKAVSVKKKKAPQ